MIAVLLREETMNTAYTALIQRDGSWWIGWIEEIPGVNCQGRTREELIDNLRSALKEALEMNCEEARGEATETSLSPCRR